MKRLALTGLAVALICAGAGSAAPGSAEQAVAQREALRLLDGYRPPPGAVRIHAVPKGVHLSAGVGAGSLFGKVVERHRLWLVPLPVKAFQRWFFHRLSRWHMVAGGTVGGPRNRAVMSVSATFAKVGFGGRATRRMLSLVAAKAGAGRSVLRADVVYVWRLSAAEKEEIPVGVSEIEIRGVHGKASVTRRDQVRKIVGWFNHLQLREGPFLPFSCGATGGSRSVTFTFRGRHGTLAKAAVPDRSGACSAATYTIGGKARTPLIAGEVDRRVEKLLVVKLLR